MVPAMMQEWSSEGHWIPTEALELFGTLASIALVLVLVVLLVRGWLRRDLFRAVETLGEKDQTAVHDALVEAEKRTVGEVLPVVLERSDRHPEGLWLAAMFVALVGSASLAHWLPWDRPVLLLLAQTFFGAGGYLLAVKIKGFHRAFVRESRATEMAEEQAFQEFYRNGLHETQDRTGVILFVSLFERRVVVLADRGIDRLAEEDAWVAVDSAVLRGVAGGSLSSGLVEGIRLCGDALEKHFPWRDGDRNEIPDRLIVREE